MTTCTAPIDASPRDHPRRAPRLVDAASSDAPPTSRRLEPAPTPRKVATMVAVLALAVFMASLDLFIVNLAFPYIAREYRGTSLSSLS